MQHKVTFNYMYVTNILWQA